MVSDEEKNKKEDSQEENQVEEGKETGSSNEEHHPESPVTHRIRHNPWILSTIVLGILVIILLAGVFESDGVQNQNVNIQNVGEKVESFYEHYGIEGTAVSDVKVSEKDNYFYRVELMYKGETLPFYVTKSGYMAGNYLVSIEPDEDGNYQVPGMSGGLTQGEEATSTETVSESNETQETSANLP
ncbi:MAG: hypothetical protein ABEI74_00035 [Candidatus Pacearchaeota archaeon]